MWALPRKLTKTQQKVKTQDTWKKLPNSFWVPCGFCTSANMLKELYGQRGLRTEAP